MKVVIHFGFFTLSTLSLLPQESFRSLSLSLSLSEPSHPATPTLRTLWVNLYMWLCKGEQSAFLLQQYYQPQPQREREDRATTPILHYSIK